MANGTTPLILVTNDDGVMAPGIEALAEAASVLGEVVVIAPDRNQSGISHAISLHRPLRAHEIRPGWLMVDGTPADCVYLGLHELLPRTPDLVLSGVNAGANMSFDVHYSGTVGGAMEGTLLGVPAIASSLTDVTSGSYRDAAQFTVALAARVLEEGLPPHTTLNVNFPGGVPTQWQLTFLGHRLFRHSVHRRDDPRGRAYYWIGGEPERPHDLPGSDCNAVAEGLISVTPLGVDLSARRGLFEALSAWDLPGREQRRMLGPPHDLSEVPTR